MLKLGLPKGPYLNMSTNLVRLLFGEFDKRQLRLHGDIGTAYFLKSRDIPTLVSEGLLDFGITSTEWIYETDREVDSLRSINWCNTRLSLVSNRSLDDLIAVPLLRCVTEYPNTARRFFKDMNIHASVYKLSGSCEGLVPDIFDCAIDCVETGSTLRANGLKEIFKVLDSHVTFIKRRSCLVGPIVKRILDYLEQVDSIPRQSLGG